MIQGMNHFTITAEDREATLGFYCGLLGLVEGPRPDLGFPGVVGRRSARCGWAISTPPACRRQRLTTAC